MCSASNVDNDCGSVAIGALGAILIFIYNLSSVTSVYIHLLI
jgi:hypothetical protein